MPSAAPLPPLNGRVSCWHSGGNGGLVRGHQPPILDNGSGLSRQERITAQGLLTLLRATLHPPPRHGLFGLLADCWGGRHLNRMADRGILKLALGNGIKTGTLRDVVAIAGYSAKPQPTAFGGGGDHQSPQCPPRSSRGCWMPCWSGLRRRGFEPHAYLRPQTRV